MLSVSCGYVLVSCIGPRPPLIPASITRPHQPGEIRGIAPADAGLRWPDLHEVTISACDRRSTSHQPRWCATLAARCPSPNCGTPGASDPRLMPTSPPGVSSVSAVDGSPPRMPRPMSFGPFGSAVRSRRHPRRGCITSGCWTILCSTFGCRLLHPDCDRHQMYRPRSIARPTEFACTTGRSSRTPSRETFRPAMGWREAWPRCSDAQASCRRWSPLNRPSIEERYRCRAWKRSAVSCLRGLAVSWTWLRLTAIPGSRRSRACCSCGGTSECERRSSWPESDASTCWSAIDSSSSSMAVHSTPARTSNATASRISSSPFAATSSYGSRTGW